MITDAERSGVRKVALGIAAMVTAAGLAASAAADQKFIIRPVVREGDSVSGIGLVTKVEGVQVSNSGSYLIWVDTDAAPEGDGALITAAGPILRQGQSMTEPAGATLKTIHTFAMNAGGDHTYSLDLTGTGGLSKRAGLYRNGGLIRQSGTTPPTDPSFPAGSQFVSFFDVSINDDGDVLARTNIQPGDLIVAHVLFSTDAGGALIGEEALVADSQRLHQTKVIDDLSSGQHRFAASNRDGVALLVVNISGWSLTDTILYRWEDGVLTEVLREGDPAPVPGRLIGDMLDKPLDMNNSGAWVMRGKLDGDALHDDAIILKSDMTVPAREHGPVPAAIGPYEYLTVGSEYGPVEIDDAGHVAFYAQWSDPNSFRDSGLLRDDRLLVQEGVTVIDGRLVKGVSSGRQSFAASANGGFVLATVALEDGTTDGLAAAVMIEFCRADLNEDGLVDFSDYLEFLNLFDGHDARADFNDDGFVDFGDYLEFLNRYDAGC